MILLQREQREEKKKFRKKRTSHFAFIFKLFEFTFRKGGECMRARVRVWS